MAKPPPTKCTSLLTLEDRFGKRVTHDEFEFQDGDKKTYLLFGADKESCVVFPVTDKREVIAVKIYRYAARDALWELPGGSPNEGERHEETARRELLEETGYNARQLTRLGGYGIWFDPASFRAVYAPFLAIGCYSEKEARPEDDVMEKKLIRVEHWLKMIETGEVIDSKTIVTTMLALRHLGLRVEDFRKY